MITVVMVNTLMVMVTNMITGTVIPVGIMVTMTTKTTVTTMIMHK